MSSTFKTLGVNYQRRIPIAWVCIIFIWELSAQSVPSDTLWIPDQQLELRHDNDFLLTTDQYYSSGLFLTYRRNFEQTHFRNSVSQIDIGLSQQVYTPSNTESESLEDYDRPYAAFTGLSLSYGVANSNRLIKGTLQLGQAGPDSGAGDFQRWYHNAVVISAPPAWIGEIDNSFHITSYLSVVKEWELEPNPFGIRFAPGLKAALGTKDVYIEPEMAFHFGRRNPLHKSIAYSRLGSIRREIYFTLKASYRFVSYNALIEGHPSGDDSPLVFEPERGVMRIGFDLYHRIKRNDYKVSYRYLGPEVPGNNGHNYLILSYALSFGSR